MNKNKVQTIVGFLVVTSAAAAQAQTTTGKERLNDSTATTELKEVSVIGKSQARRLQEQAYAISVVDLKTAYNAAGSLNNLLNHVSSVRIRENGGMGSDYNFTINGFSGNQVKFFLDGIPMDNFGSSFNLASLSTSMADRVEVYKGVLPVYLGGDALGGAVNIITRQNANYLDASYSVGSFNTHKAAVNGAWTDAETGFTVRMNAFYNYSDNDYKVFAPVVNLETNQKTGDQWVKRFHDAYQSMGLRAETGVTGRPWADYLLAGVILAQDWKDQQTGATMDAVYGGMRTKSHSVIPSLRYKKEDLFTDGLSLSLYGTYNIVDDFNKDVSDRRYNWLGQSVQSNNKGEAFYTDAKITNREWQAIGNLNYIINPHQSLMLNHTFSSLTRKSNDKVHPDNEMNNRPQVLTKNVTGLGWQIRYDRWNANLFGKMYKQYSTSYKKLDQFTDKERWEKQSSRQLNFGYGAATTYFILPSLQVKLSYELAYRLPENVEIFGDGLIQQSNPDLKPEKSHNLNVGLIFDKFWQEHHLYAETNFIYRNTSDFILKGVSVTANPTTSYKNLGKVLTEGVEGNIRYDYKQLFHAGVNITYQRIIDNQQYTLNNDSYVGESKIENITYKQKLPNIPYFFANGNVGVSFRDVFMKRTRLTLDYTLNYVHEYFLAFPGLGNKSSKNLIPEQFSHDVSAGYTMADGRYSVMLECTNLAGAKLYDNYRLQKPGRAFSIKFRYYIHK